MSDSQVVNIVPKELDFDSKIKRGTRMTNSAVQINEYTPVSNSGDIATGSSINWSIPLSTTDIIDSRPELKLTYTITVTGTDEANAYAAAKDKLGLTSLPNHRAISVAEVGINSSIKMSTNVADDIVTPILYQLSQEDLLQISSFAVPDRNYDYSATVNTDALRTASDSFFWSRGVDSAHVESATWDAGSTTLTFVVNVVEKMLFRPFQALEGKNPHPFTNLNKLDIRLAMVSNFETACLADKTAKTTTIALKDARIRIKQYTPHLALEYPVSNHWLAPQFEHIYLDDANTIAAGAKSTAIQPTPVVSYSKVPREWAVFVEELGRDKTKPHRLLPISSLRVNNGLKKNNFESYTRQDLFEVSRRNGYNGSISQWFGGVAGLAQTTGCVMYFTPSDLHTNENEQSNCMKTMSFNVQVQVSNPTGAAITGVRVHVVAISDALLVMENGRFHEEDVVITPEELASAQNVFMDVAFDQHHILGGSFWSKLGDIVTHPITRGIVQTARNNIPGVNNLIGDQTHWGQYIRKKGYGDQPEPKKRGRKAKGAGIDNLGGQKMTQSGLMSLLEG